MNINFFIIIFSTCVRFKCTDILFVILLVVLDWSLKTLLKKNGLRLVHLVIVYENLENLKKDVIVWQRPL